MTRLHQLARQWQDRAAMDAHAARTTPPLAEVLAAIAQTRRNDAWELLQLLNAADAEHPDGDAS